MVFLDGNAITVKETVPYSGERLRKMLYRTKALEGVTFPLGTGVGTHANV